MDGLFWTQSSDNAYAAFMHIHVYPRGAARDQHLARLDLVSVGLLLEPDDDLPARIRGFLHEVPTDLLLALATHTWVSAMLYREPRPTAVITLEEDNTQQRSGRVQHSSRL